MVALPGGGSVQGPGACAGRRPGVAAWAALAALVLIFGRFSPFPAVAAGEKKEKAEKAGKAGKGEKAEKPPGGAAPGKDSKDPDTIIMARTGEKKTQYQVQKETLMEVYVKTIPRGGEAAETSRIPQDDIREIHFYDEPDSIKTAMGAREDGKFLAAVAAFKEAMGAAGARDWVKEYALYYQADSYLSAARETNNHAHYETAIKLYGEYLETYDPSSPNPKGKFVGFARRDLGVCHFEIGKLSEAKKEFEKLSKGDFERKWQAWENYWEARVAEKEGQFPKAKDMIDIAESKVPDKGGQLYTLLQSRKGYVQMGLKKPEKAVDEFEKVVKLNLPREDLAMAFNGLGEAYMAQGKFRPALLAFSRVVALHFDDREEHAKALFRASEAWNKLGKKDEADKLVAELKFRYPDSAWTMKALPEE